MFSADRGQKASPFWGIFASPAPTAEKGTGVAAKANQGGSAKAAQAPSSSSLKADPRPGPVAAAPPVEETLAGPFGSRMDVTGKTLIVWGKLVRDAEGDVVEAGELTVPLACDFVREQEKRKLLRTGSEVRCLAILASSHPGMLLTSDASQLFGTFPSNGFKWVAVKMVDQAEGMRWLRAMEAFQSGTYAGEVSSLIGKMMPPSQSTHSTIQMAVHKVLSSCVLVRDTAIIRHFFRLSKNLNLLETPPASTGREHSMPNPNFSEVDWMERDWPSFLLSPSCRHGFCPSPSRAPEASSMLQQMMDMDEREGRLKPNSGRPKSLALAVCSSVVRLACELASRRITHKAGFLAKCVKQVVSASQQPATAEMQKLKVDVVEMFKRSPIDSGQLCLIFSGHVPVRSGLSGTEVDPNMSCLAMACQEANVALFNSLTGGVVWSTTDRQQALHCACKQSMTDTASALFPLGGLRHIVSKLAKSLPDLNFKWDGPSLVINTACQSISLQTSAACSCQGIPRAYIWLSRPLSTGRY
jgi:hypothetical protein